MRLVILVFLFSSCGILNVRVNKLSHYNLRTKEAFHEKTIRNKKARANMSKEIQMKIKEQIDKIVVVHPGDQPVKPVMCFANIVITSTPNTETDPITNALIYEAARLNADVLMLHGENIASSGSYTTYSSGVAITQNNNQKYSHGSSCDYRDIELGVSIDYESGKVLYVKRNSVAEKAGLKENMYFIAINGRPIIKNRNAILIELNGKKKGDQVEIEYLNHENTKIYKKVTLD